MIAGSSQSTHREKNGYRNYAEMLWQNDAFVKRDRYFTNGLEASFVHGTERPLLFRRFRGFSLQEYSLVQHIFTPTDNSVEEIRPEDRPYAAYLVGVLSNHLYERQEGWYYRPEVVVGVIGEWAMGGRLQRYIHSIIGDDLPEGWDNQIGNDLVLDASLKLEKRFVKGEEVFLSGYGQGRLGTLYTDMELGARLRLGKMYDYFRGIANLGYSKEDCWQLFIEANAALKLVGYDATLQGGMFNRTSPYTIDSSEISRWVALLGTSLNMSLHWAYVRVQLAFSTKQFRAATSHTWAGVALGVAFL